MLTTATARKMRGLAVVLLLVTLSKGQSVLSLINGSTTCTKACQDAVTASYDFEQAAHAHAPLDEFYSFPDNFNATTKPGDIIRVEFHTDLTNYTVPSSLTMSRIMYASRSLNGTTVPATAFVLWPFAPFEYANAYRVDGSATKFPMIAWAHGTSGFFPNCAPSNYRSLQYHFMTSYNLAMEGFAVVATDYAGLGVSTRSDGVSTLEYLAGHAGANDVAYAIQAARAAFPAQFDPEGPLVTMGHSEGGNVAWAFAERQAKTPVAGYLGTVAMSPPTKIIDNFNLALQEAATTPISSLSSSVLQYLGLQMLVIGAIGAVFPAYNFSGLTDIAYDRWTKVLTPLQGCLPTYATAFADVPFSQLVRPGWQNNTLVKQWGDLTLVGAGAGIKGPFLVTLGDNDAVPVSQVATSVDMACESSPGESIELQVYRNMQHFPAIQAGHMARMNWIKDRFDAKPLSTGVCGKQTVFPGFNANYTYQTIAPNWLVDWVPPAEGWKLSL